MTIKCIVRLRIVWRLNGSCIHTLGLWSRFSLLLWKAEPVIVISSMASLTFTGANLPLSPGVLRAPWPCGSEGQQGKLWAQFGHRGSLGPLEARRKANSTDLPPGRLTYDGFLPQTCILCGYHPLSLPIFHPCPVVPCTSGEQAKPVPRGLSPGTARSLS